MKRTMVVFAVALLVVVDAAPGQARAQIAARSAVTPWIELELDAIASHRTNPPRASRALAHVSVAMHLAALAGGEARDDSVAGSASTVLMYLYRDEAARIDALADELADVDSRAFRLGRLIGQLLIARAQSDGSDGVWTGTPPVGPGFWIPTPTAFAYPPLEPLAGTWRTWNLRDGSQYRPGSPPAYGSARFTAELNEVYTVSQTLTDEQRRIADYWADGPGTVTPPGHWNLIARDLVRAADWSTLRSSRLFAALNTAEADAFIACWDAKYTYWSLAG